MCDVNYEIVEFYSNDGPPIHEQQQQYTQSHRQTGSHNRKLHRNDYNNVHMKTTTQPYQRTLYVPAAYKCANERRGGCFNLVCLNCPCCVCVCMLHGWFCVMASGSQLWCRCNSTQMRRCQHSLTPLVYSLHKTTCTSRLSYITNFHYRSFCLYE